MDIINAIINGATTVADIKNRPKPQWEVAVAFNS